MGGFVEAALSFPTVLFTPLLVVVAGYWLVVVAGGADPEGDHGDLLGLGGVPISISLSLLIVFAWFAALAGGELLPVPGWLILIGALVVAWLLTLGAARFLRRVLPTGPDASRADFVGLTCVIRTGRVTGAFGQAEVHAPDGSSAIVQVRQAGQDDLHAGTVALLYDVDPDGDFFWVVPADIATKDD